MDNCSFETIIEASSTEDGTIKLVITSKCQSIQKLLEEIAEVDPFQIAGRPIMDCLIYKIANDYLRHPACIVPSAIVRTIEVESGMALPGKSSISVEKS
jgi:DNA-directed RNA polymerase specialized sigma54-like protein